MFWILKNWAIASANNLRIWDHEEEKTFEMVRHNVRFLRYKESINLNAMDS